MQAEGREVNPPSLLQFLFDRDRAYIYYALFGDPSKPPEKKKVAHFFRVLIRDQARDFLVTMERISSPKLQRLERRIFGYMRLVKATIGGEMADDEEE